MLEQALFYLSYPITTKVTQTVAHNTIPKGIRRTPRIPLERAEGISLQKLEYLAYKLCNIPGDDNSPVHELFVLHFGTGTCEEWLTFRDYLEKVIFWLIVVTAAHIVMLMFCATCTHHAATATATAANAVATTLLSILFCARGVT